MTPKLLQCFLEVLNIFPTPFPNVWVGVSCSLVLMEYFHVATAVTDRGVKFICKDRGGGGKWLYLDIVKIENVHPILTPSLSSGTMAIPWQFCRTIGPLTFHSQEIRLLPLGMVLFLFVYFYLKLMPNFPLLICVPIPDLPLQHPWSLFVNNRY